MSNCKKLSNYELRKRLFGDENDEPVNKGGATKSSGFPGEYHAILKLPDGSYGKANYMGPGTQLIKRLERGDQPRTYTDKVSQAHDIRYGLAKSQEEVAKADKKMIETLQKASGKDSNFNIQMGLRPIQAKYYAEKFGVIKPGRIASFGDTTPGKDTDLLRSTLATLESEGFGLAGGCATCQMNNVIGFDGGCLSCMCGGSILDDIKNKPEQGLTTNKINEILNIVKFDNKSSIIFGSYAYSAQPFASDIDMRSVVIGCCTQEVIFKKMKKILQDIPKKLSKKRGVYFGEIKVGYDMRYFIDIDNSQFSDVIENLYYDKLLSVNEYNKIMNLYENNDKNSRDELKEIIRNLYILRWSRDEIIKGFKILKGNKKITLLQAMRQRTQIKVDIFAPINGRYIEVSNFYYMIIYRMLNESNEVEILNIDHEKLDSTYIAQMKTEVRKLSSPVFENLFKMAKRMWLLGRASKDEELLEKLTPLFQGNIARINQIKVDIDTLLIILRIIKNPPYQAIMGQIDNFKVRIAYVNDIDLNFDKIYEILDSIVNNYKKNTYNFTKKQRELTIESLEALLKYLKGIVRENTLIYLKNVGLYPVPQYIYNIPEGDGTEGEYISSFVNNVVNNKQVSGGEGTSEGAIKGWETRRKNEKKVTFIEPLVEQIKPIKTIKSKDEATIVNIYCGSQPSVSMAPFVQPISHAPSITPIIPQVPIVPAAPVAPKAPAVPIAPVAPKPFVPAKAPEASPEKVKNAIDELNDLLSKMTDSEAVERNKYKLGDRLEQIELKIGIAKKELNRENRVKNLAEMEAIRAQKQRELLGLKGVVGNGFNDIVADFLVNEVKGGNIKGVMQIIKDFPISDGTMENIFNKIKF